MAADFLLSGPVELAFVGGPDETAPLRRAVAARYLPNRVIGHLDPDAGASLLPLLADKTRVRGRAALFVCRDFACQAPVTDPDAVADALAGGRPRAGSPAGTRDDRRPRDRGGHGALRRAPWRAPSARLRAARIDRPRGEPPGLRRLPRRRRDARAPAGAGARARGGREPRRHLDELHGRRQRAPGRRGAARAIEDGTAQRDEVVLVSKIGYVQGANLEVALQREREQRPFPEMVKYGEGIWHCLHPEFLEDQLARSRARLGVETLDVCLLHNPEYFLKDEHERSHGTLESRRAWSSTRACARRSPGWKARSRPGAWVPTASPPTRSRPRRTIPRRRRSSACWRWRRPAAISACCSSR